MGIVIRPASSEADYKAAFALVQALAIHEKTAQYFKITEADFAAQATADKPLFQALIACDTDKIVGAATYFRRFHIWNNSDIFILDDLFVLPASRGQGIGTQLLEVLGSQAKQNGIPVKWQVQTENQKAAALYKRMGADIYTSGICWWWPDNIG